MQPHPGFLMRQQAGSVSSAFIRNRNPDYDTPLTMRQTMLSGKFAVPTHSHMELVDITPTITRAVASSGIKHGICYIFNPHTTAGLTINEGADPSVQDDIIAGLREIVPLSFPYKHLEGNSASHIMASLMGSSLTVFIENGQLALGTWQKIFFCEFDGPRTRTAHWRILATT